MSVEIFLRKRKAREGEIGLFVESQIFDEEWASIGLGAEVDATLSVPVHEKYRKAFHALCGLLAEAVEFFGGSKDFAKEQLLLRCRHVTYHLDQVRPKTTKTLDSDGWRRLLRRADWVIETEYLPGIPAGALREELLKRCGFHWEIEK